MPMKKPTKKMLEQAKPISATARDFEYTPAARARCAAKMRAARAQLATNEVLIVWYCPRDIAAGDVQMLPVARVDVESALSALVKCHNVSSSEYPHTLMDRLTGTKFPHLLTALDQDGQADKHYCYRAGEDVHMLHVSVWAAQPEVLSGVYIDRLAERAHAERDAN